MIQVQGLRLSLGAKLILDGIDFCLPDGENLVILGRSGSGKTVLIKCLLGLYPPEKGSIIIDGKDIFQSSREERSTIKNTFAMVFQHAALLDSFTVYQNVALPLYERGNKDESFIQKRVNEALALVGLEHTQKQYPSELSGGMRKRIGIARALVYEPSYIIFDEPVSGLDPITASETLYYMSEIIASKRATLITITHDLGSIAHLGQKALFIEMGKMLYYGDIEDIRQDKHPTIQRYFLG
ncbi:MAG: ATP-binding cassette domain-containing protein [Candidatus Cloacimonetes bacterium]|nr:ATP-binding cassette domain-containing protein [Candidatus Cloacimonadota bacterium]